MEDLFNSIASSISKLYTEQRELAAIWLNKPVVTSKGRTVRIAPDDLITIENGLLVDNKETPTHKIIACFGTLNSQFEITVVDLSTNEPSQIKL